MIAMLSSREEKNDQKKDEKTPRRDENAAGERTATACGSCCRDLVISLAEKPSS